MLDKWSAFHKDSPEGHEIESRANTSSSCIDLVFTTNSCFVKNSGVELSLFDEGGSVQKGRTKKQFLLKQGA